jgi:hypothetical protein
VAKLVEFKKSLIWKQAFESEEALAHSASVEALIAVFDKVRNNAKSLVSEIAIDLPNFTVHDIEHLDALWELGSQIVGSDFRLNPVEGFILGCGFLFHDAAMTVAAYPRGVSEIKESIEWVKLSKRLASELDKPPEEAYILETLLREQHAVRAEKLPRVYWKSDIGERYLIDDADERERFGEFIGLLAASHWWDHQKLEAKLNALVIPAPSPFPSSWSIDLLKLACVLRTADVAQLDERRAPGFTRALRAGKITGVSAAHWNFQNKLSQAQRRDDTLVFASLRPFKKDEANAWWTMYDTLKMVDRELRKTDDLLSRCRGQEDRFAARRVRNIEAPETLRHYVHTQDWLPIDTAFSVADIPKLIESLGGNQLYGDKTAALREIVQNGMDAARLRSLVDPGAPPPMVYLELTKNKEEVILTVRDNGVGMSETNIVEKLLSFGRSGWLSDDSIGEFNDEFPVKNSISGRYGIGFFSVFMLANSVKIKSRRFDVSPDNTVILTFDDGLNSRPLMCRAENSERMTVGGTAITIVINRRSLEAFDDRTPSYARRRSANFVENIEGIIMDWFPASDIPITVVKDTGSTVIDGRNWQYESEEVLLQRIEGDTYVSEPTGTNSYLTLLTEPNGDVVGRAAFAPDRLVAEWKRRGNDAIEGAIVAKGARVCGGRFRGMILGYPTRASRDKADPVPSREALSKWATEQARVLPQLFPNGEDQLDLASRVAAVDGDVGQLKICEVGGEAHNRESLRDLLLGLDEIWLAQDAAIITVGRGLPGWLRSSKCISANMGIPATFQYSHHQHVGYGRDLSKIAIEIIAEVFRIDASIVLKLQKGENGRYLFRAQCPSWVNPSDGNIEYTGGYHFTRGMTLNDVDKYLVGKAQNEN